MSTPGPSSGGLTEAERGKWDEKHALSLLLRRTARTYLRMKDGDYWPSDVGDAQANAILASDWLADHVAAARRDAWEEGYGDGYLDGLADGREGLADTQSYRAALDPVTPTEDTP